MSKSAVALLAALALGAGACGSDGGSNAGTTAAAGSAGSAVPTAAATVALSLTETGCDPVTLSAHAGSVTFHGASGSYTVDLAAGDHQIICGRPSDTRAKLTVTGEGGGQQALTVDTAALDAATAAYAAYVDQQVDQLVAGTTELVDAVKGGDVAAAKTLYAPVRRPWERIEPVAELFPDSDGAIDSRVDDFGGADDPAFTGFHRIEKGLWEDGSTNGLAGFADQLQTDVGTLATNVRSLQITPEVMVNGAAGLIEEAAQTKITGEEERYSHTDLDTFAANVDGPR